MVVADLTARDAIAAGRRFQGMTVYVVSDTTTYQLKTGILNADWVEYGGGSGAVTYVETFSGDNDEYIFTLGADPLSIENTTVYIDGVYQQKTLAYTLSGLDITFTGIPPIGTDNIEVIYTLPSSPLVIPDNYITPIKLETRLDVTTTGAVGQLVIYLSYVTFFYQNTTETDVTNLTVTITTKGGPVFLTMVSDGSTSDSVITVVCQASGSTTARLRFYRSTTQLNSFTIGENSGPYPSNISFPPSAFVHIDTPAAGTHTYKIRTNTSSTANTGISFTRCVLVAYEL
jgi:hypothetical protein